MTSYTPVVSPEADSTREPTRGDDLIGVVFDGRYEVLEHLADGGMARVYIALDRRLDREVVLKVLKAHLGEDEDFVRRFEREARVAARLQHPHIVSVFDQGRDHGHLFIAMEYVPGRTLRQVLQAEGALTPRAALDLMVPVLDALGHAHRLGDIHRDVKPENVLIREDGVVKVADFGLTRAVSSQTVTSATGILLGTVAYVSPEQVGRGVADKRSDVYAAGLVLFELLTGEKAFGGDVPLHVAFQHVHEGAPLLSGLVAGVPPALDDLVAAATAIDPDERPIDALAFRDEVREVRKALSPAQLDRHLTLDPAAQAGATPAPRASATEQHRAPVRGGRPASSGVASTAALPVEPDSSAGASGNSSADRTALLPLPAPTDGSSVPEEPSDAAPRRRRWPWVLVALAALLLAGTAWVFTAGPLTPTPVPNLAGQPLEAAQAALAKVELTHRQDEVFSETVPKGSVVDSDPKAGVTIWRIRPVTLHVSKGPERYAVPTLAGLPITTAESQITSAKLTVGTKTDAYDETVPAGSIVSTDPVAGSPLPPGGPVNLVVSKGRQPIEIADWTGKSADEASAALTGAGLKVDAGERANSDTVPKGSVISQNPTKGPLFKGDSVKLVVSEGPPLVTVPDVVGRQADTATAALESLGFKVKVQKLLPGINFGTVQSTDPPGGTSAPKGSTITLKTV